ncbi:MAG: N-acetylneuraminate synthase family protein [Spirochaetales bacterium]|jgi:sialic acid synthase SpsE|nr:N-acetylneuraminate synthase family protein [Spirochaetales bacterium]
MKSDKHRSFELSEIPIGAEFPPLVIAELGINHEGSLQTAFEMVDAAARAGVQVLKHQTHVVDDEMMTAAKKVIPGNADVSIYEIMKRCALSESEEIRLKEYVESKGMIFLSTPFSRAAALRLERMGVSAYKIGSGECNNYPLIDLIASFGKPMIVSTGMNTLISIKKTVGILEKHGVDYALLHTTNLYPTPNHLVRLGAMQEMANAFHGTVYGLSDHTVNNYACLAAVALGASILERHFTDRMTRSGPDIICSMDEQACRELVEGSRIIWEQSGGEKGPALEEGVTIDFAFASVCTISPVTKGEFFSEKNIWVKRPGKGGIPAGKYDQILGLKAMVDLDVDIQLQESDVVWEQV